MFCDSNTVGQFSGCSICASLNTINGTVYSWVDYTTFNPCGQCYKDSFGYAVYTSNKYSNTCQTCRELPVDSNGLPSGVDIQPRSPAEAGLSPKCYLCEEKRNFVGNTSYSFVPRCPAGTECDPDTGACTTNGLCFDENGNELTVPPCHTCLKVPEWGGGPQWPGRVLHKVMDDCRGPYDVAGNYTGIASNTMCVFGDCICLYDIVGGPSCPKDKPTLQRNGFNLYQRKKDIGCWCECIYDFIPPDERCSDGETYNPDICKCEYDASLQSSLGLLTKDDLLP